MKAKNILGAGLAAACLMTAGAVRADDTPPPIPATPAAVGEIVAIRAFELETAYENAWRFDRTPVTSGYLMVIEVSKDLALPRQLEHPVLYVGGQVAEIVNQPHESGRAVVLVPAELEDARSPEYLDLDRLLVFYGDPALPSEVDAVTIRQQQEWAVRSGIRPVSKDAVATARGADATPLQRTSKTALLADVAALIRAHVPSETELAKEYEVVAGLR